MTIKCVIQGSDYEFSDMNEGDSILLIEILKSPSSSPVSAHNAVKTLESTFPFFKSYLESFIIIHER